MVTRRTFLAGIGASAFLATLSRPVLAELLSREDLYSKPYLESFAAACLRELKTALSRTYQSAPWIINGTRQLGVDFILRADDGEVQIRDGLRACCALLAKEIGETSAFIQLARAEKIPCVVTTCHKTNISLRLSVGYDPRSEEYIWRIESAVSP